jgi:excinuclease ABC subunit A
VKNRLDFLCLVGLGYLNLIRPAGTLSAGEVQRIRLAGLLGSDLTGLTILLDEPTRGLHPAEVRSLGKTLLDLRDAGNTVIVVEHDLEIIRLADRLVEMGPGAGARGGEVVAQGSPQEVGRTTSITAAWLRAEQIPYPKPDRRNPERWMTLRGARANNLKGEDVRFPLNVLTGVCGLSGSGKSTLVMDTLGRILAPRKQTTSVAYEPLDPGENDGVDGAPARTILIDQSRSGVSSPANWLGISDPLRAIYADSPDAHSLGLSLEDLAARCPVCGGGGSITIDMAFLPDLHETCEACRGTGYLSEAWNVSFKGIALPDAFGLTIEEVFELTDSDERIARPLKMAMDVGLGYLVLRQPGYSLSGGEAQRLKIAQELSKKSPRETLYILDEPTVGQHLEDVRRLVEVLNRLVEAGGSVLVVEHHPHLLASCDWLIELGPGGGPEGGNVIGQGSPETLAQGETPIAPYLREALGGRR